MLKTMRKNVKALAPTLWIVIATFVISIFAIWGGAGRLGEKGREDTIAFLGRERITMDSYHMALRNRLEALQKEFSGLNKNFIQQLNIPQQVLEQMIQQSLLGQKAREMGLTASREEVRERIVSLFQRDGKFIGYEEYRRILEYNRMSLPQFENSLKEEIVLNKMKQQNLKCNCIRCREVGHRLLKGEKMPKADDFKMMTQTYQASQGTEIFISMEDPDSKCLAGYTRLRIPSEKAHREEIAGREAGLIREIHVLGPLVPIGETDPDLWQHKGFGSRLLSKAEEMARDEYDCNRILVTSALGSRRYFAKFGYSLKGPYMSKDLTLTTSPKPRT